MYKFIDKHTVEKYNGEAIKEYDNGKLVNIILNPSEEQLKALDYKEIVDGDVPKFDEETQYLVPTYRIENGVIVREYEVEEADIDDISE